MTYDEELHLAVGFETESLKSKAEELARSLNLPINNEAKCVVLVTSERVMLKYGHFKPICPEFNADFWQKRLKEGKKQGLVKACKPKVGIKIIDASAGWGRDAAVLASFGAEVLMLERNPVMAVLLEDALAHQDLKSKEKLNLKLLHTDAKEYFQSLDKKEYPHIIYIDPMHPPRQKSALVKKDLQALQHMIGHDEDALSLIKMAREHVLDRVVVKWPQQVPALLPPTVSINGKTVRFDIYLS